MGNFQAWASVKVINEDSEHVGRAGVVVREERGGAVVVKLDLSEDKPEVVVNFAIDELRGL